MSWAGKIAMKLGTWKKVFEIPTPHADTRRPHRHHLIKSHQLIATVACVKRIRVCQKRHQLTVFEILGIRDKKKQRFIDASVKYTTTILILIIAFSAPRRRCARIFYAHSCDEMVYKKKNQRKKSVIRVPKKWVIKKRSRSETENESLSFPFLSSPVATLKRW